MLDQSAIFFLSFFFLRVQFMAINWQVALEIVQVDSFSL